MIGFGRIASVWTFLLRQGVSCEFDCDFEHSDSFSVHYVLYFAFQVILNHPYHFHPSHWCSLFWLCQAWLTPRLKSRHTGRRLLHCEVNIVLEINSPLDCKLCNMQDFSLHDMQCHFLFDSHLWVPSFPSCTSADVDLDPQEATFIETCILEELHGSMEVWMPKQIPIACHLSE